ncbi:hypothetical protein C8R45DRAFT_1070295 [Mycena sanguinolenta]|nr:hypothetical protein C8R45DRAFT_1070295 [Mycena sanguinolenta]
MTHIKRLVALSLSCSSLIFAAASTSSARSLPSISGSGSRNLVSCLSSIVRCASKLQDKLLQGTRQVPASRAGPSPSALKVFFNASTHSPCKSASLNASSFFCPSKEPSSHQDHLRSRACSDNGLENSQSSRQKRCGTGANLAVFPLFVMSPLFTQSLIATGEMANILAREDFLAPTSIMAPSIFLCCQITWSSDISNRRIRLHASQRSASVDHSDWTADENIVIDLAPHSCPARASSVPLYGTRAPTEHVPGDGEITASPACRPRLRCTALARQTNVFVVLYGFEFHSGAGCISHAARRRRREDVRTRSISIKYQQGVHSQI